MGKRIAVSGSERSAATPEHTWCAPAKDVTFIDMWPAHVDEMKGNGLRITHHEGEEPFTVKVRALHLTERSIWRRSAGRHRLCLHQILRHATGSVADPAVSGTRRLCRLAAELHE